MANGRSPVNAIGFIKRCLETGRVRWTNHVRLRMEQRDIPPETLLAYRETLEVIEEYPDDKYIPSYLVRGESGTRVFHAHVATDVEGDNVRVVTMYYPRSAEWDRGFRIRTVVP